MAGSSLATSALEVNLRVNWPVIGDGWAEANSNFEARLLGGFDDVGNPRDRKRGNRS